MHQHQSRRVSRRLQWSELFTALACLATAWWVSLMLHDWWLAPATPAEVVAEFSSERDLPPGQVNQLQLYVTQWVSEDPSLYGNNVRLFTLCERWYYQQ